GCERDGLRLTRPGKEFCFGIFREFPRRKNRVALPWAEESKLAARQDSVKASGGKRKKAAIKSVDDGVGSPHNRGRRRTFVCLVLRGHKDISRMRVSKKVSARVWIFRVALALLPGLFAFGRHANPGGSSHNNTVTLSSQREPAGDALRLNSLG